MDLPVFSRQIVRNWLMRRGRVGRAEVRKIFNRILDPEQTVELLPGLTMKLDLRRNIQESIFWFFEEVEPALQWAIKRLLSVGGIFVDVGANIGLMGLLAIYYRRARVIFVEPHPRLAHSLRTNLALNKFEGQASVQEVAASSANADVELKFHPVNDGGHSIEPLDGSRETCRVPARRLEDLFDEQGITGVDLLKIDVEGHDFQVLQGLGCQLDPSRISMIFVEMTYNNAFRYDIWNLLLQMGYAPFAAVPLYIDHFRELERLEQSGHVVTFFRPLTNPGVVGGLNVLWCEKGGPIDGLLSRLYQVAVNR